MMPYNLLSKFNLKKAFTLAETIMALVIVGVIATETIPPLLISIDKARFHSAAKKFYAEYYQAHTMLLQDYSGNMENAFGDYDNSHTYLIALSKYLNLTAICQAGLDETAGYPNSAHANEMAKCYPVRKFEYYNGFVFGDFISGDHHNSGAKLSNGVSVTYRGSFSAGDSLYFDVNGGSPPNKFGYDLYRIKGVSYNSPKLNIYYNPAADNCNATGLGNECIIKLLKNEPY